MQHALAGDLAPAGQHVLRADVFEDAQQQLQLVRPGHEPVLAMASWVRQHTGAERPHSSPSGARMAGDRIGTETDRSPAR